MTIVDCTLLAEVDIISAGVVGLLALIVIVFAILSAKNWHWVNVVFLILTLITSITAIIGMTFVYQHRREGLEAYKRESKAAEDAEKRLAEVVVGDPLSVKYGKKSLRYNDNQLALAMTARGRSWRGVKVTVDGDEHKFTLGDENNSEDNAALSQGIVYAFAENGKNPGRKVPDLYIGSMFVTAETDAEGNPIPGPFTLEPVALVDVELFDNPKTTWTLYEKMPPDRRGIFKQALRSAVNSREPNAELSPAAKQRLTFVENLDDESKQLDISEFTQILKRDFLPARRLGYDANSLAYEQMIDQYAFDGQSVSRIQTYVENAPGRKSTLFEPTPEQKFIKYTFTANSEVAVKTDGIGTLEAGIFNTAGEAVVGKLMQNPDGVTFKKDDVILIDEPSSGEFEREHAGKLKKIDTIFRRELQDFPLIFKNRKVRIAKLEDEIVTAQATIVKTKAAIDKAKEQINVRTDLLSKNTEDKEGFEKDSGALQQTNASFKEQSAELAREISEREAKIESLYQQIQTRALERLRAAVSVSR